MWRNPNCEGCSSRLLRLPKLVDNRLCLCRLSPAEPWLSSSVAVESIAPAILDSLSFSLWFSSRSRSVSVGADRPSVTFLVIPFRLFPLASTPLIVLAPLLLTPAVRVPTNPFLLRPVRPRPTKRYPVAVGNIDLFPHVGPSHWPLRFARLSLLSM